MSISENLEKMLSSHHSLTPEMQKMQDQYRQMLSSGLIQKQVYDLPLANGLGPSHFQQTNAFHGR
ncbi:hypothetical protein [Chitinilyticum litopenaei]|uniref:hypothetical protein n=1 Tax=Chitinilyticum litopenaei TaxID=1121276 RepID=UPI00130DA040|nr:hypothetical protein [Chitinilyticum litopenaei]